MKRRLFIKNTGMFTAGAMFFPVEDLIASNERKNSHEVNLSSAFFLDKKIEIEGVILDAVTHLPVAANIIIKAKKSRLFSNEKSITTSSGKYKVNSGINNNTSDKIQIEISADGYKSFKGNLYVTANGCSIHSDMWKYNPDFKPDYSPKNKYTNGNVNSIFNFYLVKV